MPSDCAFDVSCDGCKGGVGNASTDYEVVARGASLFPSGVVGVDRRRYLPG